MPSTSLTPETSLAALLDRVARRDRTAFAALYTSTSAKLYGTILRIIKRRDVAEEVLQEVYVTIWEHAGDFDPARGSPMPWMTAIARNRAIDQVRRTPLISLEDLPPEFEPPSEAPLPLDRLIEADDGVKLHACLQGLPAEKREIVVQAYFFGLSREELAKRFGHPVPTIKTWLRRSLAQLRECLG